MPRWFEEVLDGAFSDDDPRLPAFVPQLGITVSGWSEGQVELGWEPPAWTRTPGGWVQGGFLGVPLDMAQTFALMTRLPETHQMAQTLEQKVSFIDAPFAERFVVSARALRWGKRAGHTDGEIRDTDGKLIATSTATFVVREMAGPPG